VRDNPRLGSIGALTGPTTIPGSVVIGNNPQLVNALLQNVVEIGGDLDFEGNPMVQNFQWAGNEWSLKSIGGSLILRDNAGLNALFGFEKLADVGGDLIFSNLPGLTDLTELYNLTHVGGTLSVTKNAGLRSLDGLDRLTAVDGNFNVVGNPSLKNIMGPGRLAAVGGNTLVDDNQALTFFASGLRNPKFANSSSLTVTNNLSLDEIRLIRVDSAGTIRIANNAALATLSLDGLYEASTFDVENNPKLPECAVDAMVAKVTFHTTVIVSGNDTTATCK
jgi:hypothetical protein